MLGDLPTLPTRVYGHGMGSKEPAYDTVPSYKKKKKEYSEDAPSFFSCVW